MEQIKTKRLLLRPYTLEDIDSVHLYGSDESVVKYMLFGPNTLEETEKFVLKIINEYYLENPLKHLEYAIELEGIMIGGVSIHIDFENESGEMGWILNPNYHRKGIASEAAEALMKYAVKKYKLVKVIAKCDSRNVASKGVMLKLGMQQKSIEREKRIDKKTGQYEFDDLIFEVDV